MCPGGQRQEGEEEALRAASAELASVSSSK